MPPDLRCWVSDMRMANVLGELSEEQKARIHAIMPGLLDSPPSASEASYVRRLAEALSMRPHSLPAAPAWADLARVARAGVLPSTGGTWLQEGTPGGYGGGGCFLKEFEWQEQQAEERENRPHNPPQ